MKKLLVSILFLLFITSLKAQFNQGLYTFKHLPLNRLYNPSAEIINEKEILIPVISHIGIQSELAGITIQEIFSNQTANQTIENFIATKNGREHLWNSEMINLFYYGFKDKKDNKFWSFGIYQESQAYSFYPADLVKVAYEGNKLDQKYNANDLRVQAVAMTVYHIGLTYKPKRSKYTFGGRVKLYNSLASVDAVNNKGYFSTEKNSNTNQEYIILDGKIRANSSGLNTEYTTAKIIKNSIFSGNIGLGVDLGLTYEIDRNWKTSLSLIDLGAIYNSRNIENYQINGTYKFEGVKIYDPITQSEDFWQVKKDNFKEDIENGVNQNNFILTLPPKLFASATYTIEGEKRRTRGSRANCSFKASNFFTPKHYFTLTSYNRLLHNYWDWAIGISYLGELNEWLGIQTNYLFSPYDKTNIGAGVSLKFKPIIFYFSVDNIPGLLDLNTAHSAGAIVGLNIIL